MATVETRTHKIENKGDLGGNILLYVTGLKDNVENFINGHDFYISAYESVGPSEEPYLGRLRSSHEQAKKDKQKAILSKLERKIEEVSNLHEDMVAKLTEGRSWHDFICTDYQEKRTKNECCNKEDELHVKIDFESLDDQKELKHLLLFLYGRNCYQD